MEKTMGSTRGGPLNGTSTTPDALKLIRVALVGGVLMLGLVAWYITNRGGREPMAAETVTTLHLGFGVLAMGALLGLFVLRAVIGRTAEWTKRASLILVSWALGEAPALMGGCVYLVTAAPLTYVLGVAILLLAFIAVPVPEPES
jgi:hypothetical protein